MRGLILLTASLYALPFVSASRTKLYKDDDTSLLADEHRFEQVVLNAKDSASAPTGDDMWTQCEKAMENTFPDHGHNAYEIAVPLPENMKKFQIPLVWLKPTPKELQDREEGRDGQALLSRFVRTRLRCCTYGTLDKNNEDMLRDYLLNEVKNVVFDAHTQWRVPCKDLYNRAAADAVALTAFSVMFAQVCALFKIQHEQPEIQVSLKKTCPKGFIDMMSPSEPIGLHKVFSQEIKHVRCGLLRGIRKLNDDAMLAQAAAMLLGHATSATVSILGPLGLTSAALLATFSGGAGQAAISSSTGNQSAGETLWRVAGSMFGDLAGLFLPLGTGNLNITWFVQDVMELWAFPEIVETDTTCTPYLEPKTMAEKCKGDKRSIAAELWEIYGRSVEPLAQTLWSA